MTDFLQRMIAAKVHSTGVIQPRPRPLFETRVPYEGADERAVAGNSDTGTGGSGQVPPPQKTGRVLSPAMPSRRQERERDDTRTGPPRSGYNPLPEKTIPAPKDPFRNDRDGKDAPGKGQGPEMARRQKSPRPRSTPEQQDEPALPGSRKRHPVNSPRRHAEDHNPVTSPAENPGAPPAVPSRQESGTEGLTVRDRPGRPGDPREKESGSPPVMPSRSPQIHPEETTRQVVRLADYTSSRTNPQEPPVVRVSIGRIEVRTETQAPESQPVPVRQPVPRLSLDDYLRSRRGDTS
jgi:hypothetical protein